MEHDTLIWEYLNSSIHLVRLLRLKAIFAKRYLPHRDCYSRRPIWNRSSKRYTKEMLTSTFSLQNSKPIYWYPINGKHPYVLFCGPPEHDIKITKVQTLGTSQILQKRPDSTKKNNCPYSIRYLQITKKFAGSTE